MKPPRSDKSFIDRLEVHIDTIVNFLLLLLVYLKPYSTSQYPITRKNINSFPPPPPHEPSQKFLSPDPGKSLHPSPENIATLLKHFKQSKKNPSPLN